MGLLGFPPRVLFLDPAIKYHFAVLNGTNNLGGCWDSHELFNKNLGKTQAAPSALHRSPLWGCWDLNPDPLVTPNLEEGSHQQAHHRPVEQVSSLHDWSQLF